MPLEYLLIIQSILKLGIGAQQALAAWLSRNPNPTAEELAEQVRNLDDSDARAEQSVDRFKEGLDSSEPLPQPE